MSFDRRAEDAGILHCPFTWKKPKVMFDRKELDTLHAQLATECKKGFADVKKCADILGKLKVF